MGDRTTVMLTVLTSQLKEAEKLFLYAPSEIYIGTALTECLFYEVNYGELEFLPKLQNLGMPYTSRWESGSEYGPGEEACRFTPQGEMLLKIVGDEYRNPPLHHLMEVIDNYGLLKQRILEHYERVTALPWDNQEEYGKIHRARQLITPK